MTEPMTFQTPIPILSTVEFLPGFDELGVTAGTHAVVVDVYHSPSLAYEVEVVSETARPCSPAVFQPKR